ncbi:MAG TPA: class 1 fructose-bisphosphatase [Phaeodactylibacter sp.]|nr:class 1 fructose-bisphosphatase [Phaeodactylibacter sp.]
MNRIVTLDEFITHRQKDFPYASGELTGLLHDIGLAAKIVNREVNKAGLVNILGKAGTGNASGDEVQKLDIYANDKLLESLRNSGECCGVASEEMEDFFPIQSVEGKQSNYVVICDPLDGSSNIDVNVSLGTIFGIYRRKSHPGGVCELDDFLQKGSELVAAGYVLYGTSTLLVFTTGKGVNGFTLDPSIGEFCLSHPNIRIAERGSQYSINQGYYKRFDERVKRFIDHYSNARMSLRYIGSMVADVHRILLKGGIFLYPGTEDRPEGKLRLLYECNPLGYLVEQAGGKAIHCTTLEPVTSIQPLALHQRVSIAIGSKGMVEEFEQFMKS